MLSKYPRRKVLACEVGVAVIALASLGYEVSSEGAGFASAVSHAAEILKIRSDGAAGAPETAMLVEAGEEHKSAYAGRPHGVSEMPVDGEDRSSSQVQSRDVYRELQLHAPPQSLEMQLSTLHSRRGAITDASQIEPQINPELIRLASDYSNPLQPGQEIYPRPSKRLEPPTKTKSASSDGPAGSEGQATTAPDQSCDPRQFVSLNGDELISRIKEYKQDCFDKFASLSDPEITATFPESKMITVANAMASDAVSYDGTNSSGILNLMRFLQTGYFLQYLNRPVGTYGQDLTTALRSALDKFSANGNFTRVDNVHGEILASYILLIDNAHQVTYKLSVYKDLYARYSSTWEQYDWMSYALDVTFGALWRAHQYEASELTSLIQTDTSIIAALYDFTHRNFGALYSSDYYKIDNAAREIARFLQYNGAAKAEASSRVKMLLARSSPAVGSATAVIWMQSAQFVGWYDAANCSAYGTCSYRADVMADVLPGSQVCSPTLKIRAQSMLETELSATCAELTAQESFFHSKLRTQNRPVVNDNNAALELVVFDSYRAYSTYAGALFGISTNNGGIYLEGNPAVGGNQARFFAHEGQWEKPKFSIWNLNHEYTHYLDARFDLYGDYSLGSKYKTVWWTEGLAEYIAHEYTKTGSPKAIAEAKLATYPVSTIFQNDYTSGNTRVYSWGYLASRFMFERHQWKVEPILSYLRAGNYSAYTNLMSSIGANTDYDYDYDFRWWLTCVGTPSASGCAGNQPPIPAFKSVSSGLTVQFMDYSTDADGGISLDVYRDTDGYVASQSWSFSDGTTAIGQLPIKRFAAPGTYDVSLTIVDDSGESRSTQGTVTVAELPPCIDADARRLTGDCMRVFTTDPKAAYFYVSVPTGVKQLRITSGGQVGDVDLYAMAPPNNGPYASPNRYTHRSINPGNGESILIDRPTAGNYQVMINNKAETVATGVITSQFVMN